MPCRIRLRRTKGWRLPAGAVKVDRTTMFGNPFVIGEPVDLRCAGRWGWAIRNKERMVESREEAVALFATVLALDGAGLALVRAELRGKDLACWCPPEGPCHADVLLQIANGPVGAEVDAAAGCLSRRGS